jgi:hypothetical protein
LRLKNGTDIFRTVGQVKLNMTDILEYNGRMRDVTLTGDYERKPNVHTGNMKAKVTLLDLECAN